MSQLQSENLSTLADPSRVDSYVPLVIGFVAAVLGLCLLVRLTIAAFIPRPAAQRQRDRQGTDEIKRATNSRWLQRAWWGIRPPHDLMVVDGLEIDRTGKRSHAIWVAPTGGGKSESVATVRCDGKRPWLAIMPDLSDPLRRKADFSAGSRPAPSPRTSSGQLASHRRRSTF